MNRRNFLLASGACLALPLLSNAAGKATGFKRLVCFSNPFGMIPSHFYPDRPGMLSEMPESLEAFSAVKNKISIFSSLDHNLSGGHDATEAVFSGVTRKEAKGRADGNISIDQKAALHFGNKTRLPYINVHLGRGESFGDLSYWTKEGIRVPAYRSAEQLFKTLFIQDNAAAVKLKDKSLQTDQSILDAVLKDIQSTGNSLTVNDRNKLNEYTASVRSVEKSLQMDRSWLAKKKPQTNYKLPRKSSDFTIEAEAMIDLIGLALETDSTRIATIGVSGRSSGRDTGLHSIYHHASHHGNENENIKQLLEFEKLQMKLLARLTMKLENTEDNVNGGTLLDNTIILFASGMSNPSSHDNKNLPVMMIGGGITHKGFIQCPEKQHRIPMSNLLLSVLHSLGIQEEKFGRSTGTFNPLKMV